MKSSEIRSAPLGANPTPAFATGTAEPAGEQARPEAPPPVPLGWDPFEVWRTRVRDARRDVAPGRAR